MRVLLLMLITFNVHAALKVENDMILPFKLKNYPMKSLVKDYAELMDMTVAVPKTMFNKHDMVNLEINSKMTKEEFQQIVYNLLHNRGFTPMAQNQILWIHNARDIRYIPAPISTEMNFPSDSRYRTFVYRLKYPISGMVARNLRPYMSRYGRVIDFSDARTLILNDTSDNIKRLVKTIEFMDQDSTFTRFVNDVPKKNPDQVDPTNEKIVELQLEKKILEKKYTELKDNMNNGVQSFPGGGVVR